jgi:uncharacterized LabA/DUF88 family protein
MSINPLQKLSIPQRKFRVITYIDGYNLYFGMHEEAIRRGSKAEPDASYYRHMWLDVQGLSESLLLPSQELVGVKYFTSPINNNRGKQERQNKYFDALRTRPLIEIIFGRFQPDRKECDHCGHPAYHPQEKKTDVNIAVNLICDALEERFDTALLVTGDSDLVPAVEAVRRLTPHKRIVVAFPPRRSSDELSSVSGGKPIRIWESLLRQNRLPDVIAREGLPGISCPNKYSGIPGCTSAVHSSAPKSVT